MLTKQTITNNFLLIVLLLAVGFAFAMRVTVFQKPATPFVSPATALPAGFGTYWYGPRVETHTYRLEQALDGRLIPGEARLDFQAEDFRTSRPVSASAATTTDTDERPALHSTLTKTFSAGPFADHLRTSVLTPISSPLYPNTLRVSTSALLANHEQGLQLTYRNNGYHVAPIEAEGYDVEKTMLEDELWNRIRQAPDKLPTGETRLMPGTMTAQLRGKRPEPLPVTAKLDTYEGVLYPGKFLKAYTVEYTTDDRTLTIVFESGFPHRIVGWEETYRSGPALLTTRAILNK